MKSRLVILDANVIIQAFRLGFWNSLISSYDIVVGSVVLHNEVYHYTDSNGQDVLIDLKTYVDDGKIKEVSADENELKNVTDKVNPGFLNRIDDGELEAIALLLTGEYDDHEFCTGDTRAIKAMGSLDIGTMGVSLEELLNNIGQSSKLPDKSYSKQAFELKKAEGYQEKEIFLKN